MGACSPPPIRQPRKHPLARINHASPGDGQVGARLTSQQVRTSSPHTVSQGWDPYLQVDEDGRHVRRAQHQPERGHVVLEERSPSAPEGRQSPSRPQSPVGGALTASEKNRRLQAAPPFPHQGSCGAAAHPAHGGAPRLLERGRPAREVWDRVGVRPEDLPGGQTSTEGPLHVALDFFHPKASQGGLCCLRYLSKWGPPGRREAPPKGEPEDREMP